MRRPLLAAVAAWVARAWLGGGQAVAAPAEPSVPAVGTPAAVEPMLLVRVLEEATLAPLPNAEVIDLDTGARRFTSVAGEARLAWPAAGRIRLRVRQLGFEYQDRDLGRTTADPQRVDTISVPLRRVAYSLPEVTSRAASGCAGDADPTAKALSVVALAQLRMGAERYDAFRKAYPFRVRQVRRTVRYNADGSPRSVSQGAEEFGAEGWGEPYRRGKVIDRTARGFSVPLLFLSALADSTFWEHHCFSVHGVESLQGTRALRLEFVPALGVGTVDWAGTAFVDSATSLLRRVEFQLAGLRDDDVPRRLEGFTTFRSPSPFIVIPDSTVAVWWRRDPTLAGGWSGPDVVQLLRVTEVMYRKATPPSPAADSARR